MACKIFIHAVLCHVIGSTIEEMLLLWGSHPRIHFGVPRAPSAPLPPASMNCNMEKLIRSRIAFSRSDRMLKSPLPTLLLQKHSLTYDSLIAIRILIASRSYRFFCLLRSYSLPPLQPPEFFSPFLVRFSCPLHFNSSVQVQRSQSRGSGNVNSTLPLVS